MATTQRPGAAYSWVTWLTPILAGQGQCTFQPWFKAHFKYEKVPSTFDLAAWSADHNAMVSARATKLRAEGWAVSVENQNSFKVVGKAGVVAGKMDIVAMRGDQVRVEDGKTGQQTNKDWWQVLLYLFLFPLAFPDRAKGKTLSGAVIYKKDVIVPVTIEELTPERRSEIVDLIQAIGGEKPEAIPSEAECRWCDITAADCPVRFGEGSAVPILTSEF